ncbi:MAG: hypothetical protein OHK0029_35980 [Armatimonadaceae bacterium]
MLLAITRYGQKIFIDDAYELSFDRMVDIFDGRLYKWHLEVAKHLADPPDPQGYAALAIVLAIPETIWQYRQGKTTDSTRKRTSKSGDLDTKYIGTSKKAFSD